MMFDTAEIVIGFSIILLTWTVARLNDKVDRQIKRFRRFEEALKKNATGKTRQNATDYKRAPQDVYR
jgi:hypothetical protein